MPNAPETAQDYPFCVDFDHRVRLTKNPQSLIYSLIPYIVSVLGSRTPGKFYTHKNEILNNVKTLCHSKCSRLMSQEKMTLSLRKMIPISTYQGDHPLWFRY